MPRLQRTLADSVTVEGFGLFHGHNVSLTLVPAPEHHGVVFQRVDLPGAPRIPASIHCLAPQLRRTALRNGPAVVEMTEHLLAALAGMQVDNCLVQLNAPEPPVLDGSSRGFVDAIKAAQIVEQGSLRREFRIFRAETHGDARQGACVALAPSPHGQFRLSYELDYRHPAIGRQSFECNVTDKVFDRELAGARTFVLATEVQQMQSAGYGLRATTENVLVIGDRGPIENSFCFANECSRHKALDCIGDFALLGCDLIGEVHARQSGHSLNQQVVLRLDRLMRELQSVRTVA